MSSNLNVALFQLDLIWESPKENLKKVSNFIDSLSNDIDLIVLPEMFTTGFTMNPYNSAELMAGNTIGWLQNKAIEKQIAIVGSLVIGDGENYFNRLVFVHPKGKIATYDKRHLFTYGGEDKVYNSGNERLIVDYKGWKICPMICYDLRFPVWSRNDVDYDLLIYVANWPKPRISAWDTLLNARAIENMCYTIGVNRVGVDGNSLEYIGHSQTIDMLGKQLNFSVNDEIVSVIKMEKEKLNSAREKFRFLDDKDSFKIL